MKNFVSVMLAIIFVILVAVAGYLFLKSKNDGLSGQIVCTQEAKVCPDGSYVGRTEANCEFAQCPSATTIPINTEATITKTFVDVKQGVSFDYVDNFYMNGDLTNYIHPVEWPPHIVVSTSTFKCVSTGNAIGPDGKTASKNINGKNYCLTMQSEGAAGSTYTTYTYKLPVAKKVVAISFIVRTPQCANYDEPKQTECKNEETTFPINEMVDKIFNSIKWMQ